MSTINLANVAVERDNDERPRFWITYPSRNKDHAPPRFEIQRMDDKESKAATKAATDPNDPYEWVGHKRIDKVDDAKLAREILRRIWRNFSDLHIHDVVEMIDAGRVKELQAPANGIVDFNEGNAAWLAEKADLEFFTWTMNAIKAAMRDQIAVKEEEEKNSESSPEQ